MRMLPHNINTNTGIYDYELPDKSMILIGVEDIYSGSETRPKECEVDLGGTVPFVAWKHNVIPN